MNRKRKKTCWIKHSLITKKETLVLYFVEDRSILQLFYQGIRVDLFLQKDLIVIEIAGSSQDDVPEYDINKIPFIICKKIIVHLIKIKVKQSFAI